MLFNSLPFLYLFLPATWFGYVLLGKVSLRLALAWLTLASLVFYVQWSFADLWVLIASILINFGAGTMIARNRAMHRDQTSNMWLVIALVINIAALAFFKYANFLLENFNMVVGGNIHALSIALPLGISFFTFTQIAYLVDVHQGKAREYDPLLYALFVTYFPHLIAGPILHHKEMMSQFQRPCVAAFGWSRVAVGLTIFGIGLFKKVVIADALSPFADAVFNAPAGTQFSFAEAWAGTLAYTLQIYFDFSGYCDMALGLARLFGTRLPLNFWSPYKATSIIGFWRCWHMTLSRFLRDYLYIPLGGNRKGPGRRLVNLMITMLLGGLWHGAAWTFVVWGALHGLYLAINHWWRSIMPERVATAVGYRLAAWGLTFFCVCVAWVFFRAVSFASALDVLSGMFGFHGLVRPGELFTDRFFWNRLIPGGWRLGIFYITTGLALCLFFPNGVEILRRFRPALNMPWSTYWFAWAPNPALAFVTASLALYAIMTIIDGRPSAFLYFQF